MSRIAITVELPWPPAELSPNARLHWRRRAAAIRSYRRDCAILTMQRYGVSPIAEGAQQLPLSLTFRPPTRRRFDRDNLLARMKAGLDGLADALGINDHLFDPVTVSVGAPKASGAVEVTIG